MLFPSCLTSSSGKSTFRLRDSSSPRVCFPLFFFFSSFFLSSIFFQGLRPLPRVYHLLSSAKSSTHTTRTPNEDIHQNRENGLNAPKADQAKKSGGKDEMGRLLRHQQPHKPKAPRVHQRKNGRRRKEQQNEEGTAEREDRRRQRRLERLDDESNPRASCGRTPDEGQSTRERWQISIKHTS